MASAVSEQKMNLKIYTELQLLYDSDEVWFNQYEVNNRDIALLVCVCLCVSGGVEANHSTAVRMTDAGETPASVCYLTGSRQRQKQTIQNKTGNAEIKNRVKLRNMAADSVSCKTFCK